VSGLSGGQAQAVAIARAIAFSTKVLFLDEPTAALGVTQSARVIDLVREIASQGCAVCLVSHSMPEVLEVSDEIVVLRHGRLVRKVATKDATLELVVSLMVGGG
jgi:simple sugar transport system ATP-binding protein